MDDALAAAIEDGKDTNLVGVSECLVNWEKEMKPWGFGNVDDTDSMSKSMVTEVIGKCHSLDVRLVPHRAGATASSWWKNGHCHGGFLRHEPKGYSPGGTSVQLYSVCPITAKHNLRTVDHETKGVFKPTSASLIVEDNGVGVDWPDLGWQPKASDALDLRAGTEARPAYADFGFDVSVGPTINDASNPCCRAEYSFEKIRKNLKLEKGMKVGMAVLFSTQSKPTQERIVGNKNVKLPNFKQDDVDKFYGLPDQLNIYTGEILYVGENFIEYSINSFTSCSGAIVFLLDKSQPQSVDEADYGKAVAIHSGAHPTLTDRNYGFLINAHPAFQGS